MDGKYQSQSHQRFLTSRQLLHLPHLSLLPCEGHLHRTRGQRLDCQIKPAAETERSYMLFLVKWLHSIRFSVLGKQMIQQMTKMPLCCYESLDNAEDKFRVKRIVYCSLQHQLHLGSALWGWISYPSKCCQYSRNNFQTKTQGNCHTLGVHGASK